MAEKTIKLNFFQINPKSINAEDEDEHLRQIASVFNDIPENLTNIVQSNGVVSLYEQIVPHDGLFLGTLVKNQILDIPPGFDNQNSTLRELPLRQGEGLGYSTSFIFDPDVRVLMIESSKNGPGVGSLCAFLEQNFDVPHLEPSIIINPGEYEDFLQMGSYKKFKVKIARIERGTIFNTPRRTISQIINAADRTNNDTLSYEISVRGRSDSLALARIRAFVRAFRGYKDSEEVKTLEVSGRENDDSPLQTIDFVKQRLVDTFKMERVRLIGSFSLRERYSKMLQVYDEHRPKLRVYKVRAD